VLCLAVLALSAPSIARAQGGPPMLTDDPDTPGPHYWEINVSTFLHKYPGVRLIELPLLDLNYGVGRRIQLKYELPFLRMTEDDQPTVHATGNSVAGVKWRFLGQEKELLAWSIYPQVEFETGHGALDKGLVGESRVFIMPTEVTVELNHVEFNGEIGRTFVHDGDNGWLYGLASEMGVHKRLELLAEIHGEKSGEDPTELVLNFGARQKLTKKLILMTSVGRAIRGPDDKPTLLFFAGLQVNTPGQFVFDKPHPRASRRR
jgi:hypothetical protein